MIANTLEQAVMGARQDVVVLDPERRQRLSGFVQEAGSLARASALLGIGREPIARAMSGVLVRRGTMALLLSAMNIRGI